MIGQTISHYRLTEKLGEGGMGVVYKAEDTNLKRPVALKFLAAHLLNDNEIKVRFKREGEAAAALSHPNIAVIYDINESGGHLFIAMEFVEGLSVSERVAERPLKLEESLDIAIQTAQGLQAAHESGVVHRDIKSANLMLTPKGQVKIMDFGLAQLAERSKLTETTTILGTPSYMSPEQAMGEKTDRRTDLWSLGVVLYEMVAGKLPFGGERQEAVLYGIINEEPEPVTSLRAGLPMELEWIIGKSLAKDRNERYQHAEDLLVDLRGLQKKLQSGKSAILKTQAANQTGGNPPASAAQIERAQRQKQTVLLGITALAVLLALVFAFFSLVSPPPVTEKQVRRFTLATDGDPIYPSISPNGRHLAYISGPPNRLVLWVQDMDQNQPRALVDLTNLATSLLFWSPDSQFIGFREGDVFKKVAVSGGPAATLTESKGFAPQSAWTPDGDAIVIHFDGKLFKVPSQGGKAELWFEAAQKGVSAFDPLFFSVDEGTRKFLYVEMSPSQAPSIIALDRTTGQREILAKGAAVPRYAPSGHVIYENMDQALASIWAVPFSVETMKATGSAFPIVQSGRNISLSLDGTLVYREDPPISQHRLVWRDRKGNTLGTIGQPQPLIRLPALSPDGKRVAVSSFTGSQQDIWIHEVDRPVKTRLTTEVGADLWPVWSAAGDRVAFTSGRTGRRDIYAQRADGSGETTPLLLTEDVGEYLSDWSRDERILLFLRMVYKQGDENNGDVFYARRKDDGGYEAVPFQATRFEETSPRFSPDERFIAYVSNESGQNEIYVQAFPQGGDKRRVSVNGGFHPRWRADGKELFYVEGQTLMATPISTSPSLTVGIPVALFSDQGLAMAADTLLGYDVTPEGDKFVLSEALEADTGSRPVIRVVQNWYEEFRNREQK